MSDNYAHPDSFGGMDVNFNCGQGDGFKGLESAYDKPEPFIARMPLQVQPRKLSDEALGLPERGPNRVTTLPASPEERKQYPVFSGVLAYFPDAIAAVAHLSWVGNQQHNPGQPLHWARGKSTDQEDTLLRHLMESGGGNVGTGFDTDGIRHSAKAAWRVLAKLQLEIEHDQAPPQQEMTASQLLERIHRRFDDERLT